MAFKFGLDPFHSNEIMMNIVPIKLLIIQKGLSDAIDKRNFFRDEYCSLYGVIRYG